MKLSNKKEKEFWHTTKKWHFGLGPDPCNPDGRWDYELLPNLEMVKELARARAENIINKYDIDILNAGLIELTKEVKRLRKLLK